jgi:hypothetical protein
MIPILCIVSSAFISLALMVHRSGPRTSLALLLIMAAWVTGPFAALTAAVVVSKRWPARARTILHIVTLVIALAAPAVYADDAVTHRKPQAGFMYVVVPLASWPLIGAALVAVGITKVQPKRSRT